VFGDRDAMRAAAPFPDKARARLEAEARCRGNPTRCPQGLGHGLQFSAWRLAEPTMRDLLKSVTKSENKEIAADPQRLAVIEPPPFTPQSRKIERAKASDLALDRFWARGSHG